MLNPGKKFALCASKKINILTLVLSEKKILNETKTITPVIPSWYSLFSIMSWLTVSNAFSANGHL
jgi:hypothetical protein